VFGNIGFNPDTDYNRHVNFHTFGDGIMVLFRCATGEAWPSIMLSCEAGVDCDLRAHKYNETTGKTKQNNKIQKVSYFQGFSCFLQKMLSKVIANKPTGILLAQQVTTHSYSSLPFLV
jgi:hypothetical protein